MTNSINSRRLKSIFVDISILFLIALIASIPYFVYNKFELLYYYNFEMALLNSLYFCKDIFGAQSIGKRIFKLKVINTKINKNEDKVSTLELSSFRLLLRNLFVYMWPIEIILLMYQDKRLGDIIVKTKVVPFNQHVDRINKIDIFKYLFIFILLFAITLSIIFTALFLLK